MDDPDGFPAAAVRIAGWVILLQGQASLIGFLREPFVPPCRHEHAGYRGRFSSVCSLHPEGCKSGPQNQHRNRWDAGSVCLAKRQDNPCLRQKPADLRFSLLLIGMARIPLPGDHAGCTAFSFPPVCLLGFLLRSSFRFPLRPAPLSLSAVFPDRSRFRCTHLPLISSFRITERVFSRMIFRT